MTIPYRILAAFGNNYIGTPSESGELRFYCPKCAERHGSPDRKGKLYVNIKTYKFNCFRCGYKGVINRNIKIDPNRIYEDDKNLVLEDLITQIDPIINEPDPFNLVIPIEKVIESKEATNYLLSRGFTYQQMEYYDLRVGNLNKEFGRIIIPNRVNHRVYTDFYSARTYINQNPKYHNPNKNKSQIVFNLHRIRENSPIIVVEGALTAIAAGFHAVATLGKTMSLYQASMIAKKHPSIVYINYDYGAEEFSHKACQTMRSVLPETPIKEIIMPDERDAADLSHLEYLKLIQQAQEYNPFAQELLSII